MHGIPNSMNIMSMLINLTIDRTVPLIKAHHTLLSCCVRDVWWLPTLRR